MRWSPGRPMGPPMRTDRRRVGRGAAVLLVLTLALAACSSGDGDDGDTLGETDATPPAADTPVDSAASNDEDEADGEGDDAGSTTLPDHLPIEVAPGGEVNGVFEPVPGTAQSTWVARVLYEEGSYDDVVAFYDEHFDEIRLDVAKSGSPTRYRWSWSAAGDGSIEAGSMSLRPSDRFFGGADVLEISWMPATG
jgi:hypothetical protein